MTRNDAFSLVMAMVVGAAALVMPARAEAGFYRYVAQDDSRWSNEANWECTQEPCGVSPNRFPHEPFDVAIFDIDGSLVTLDRVYEGTTSVEHGDLIIRAPAGQELLKGVLVIGSDFVSTPKPKARVHLWDPMTVSGGVLLVRDGILLVESVQSIAALTSFGGIVELVQPRPVPVNLEVRGETRLRGSSVVVHESSTLRLDGPVFEEIGSSEITGRPNTALVLGGAAGSIPFDVDGGGTLNIRDIPIQSNGVGLLKNGFGTLAFLGTGENTYGSTNVRLGTLIVDRPGIVIPSSLRIGGTGGAATVVMKTPGLAPTTQVFVGLSGIFRPTTGTVPALTIEERGTVVVESAVVIQVPSLTMTGGTLDVAATGAVVLSQVQATSIASQRAEIKGEGDIGAPRRIVATRGPQAVDLWIGARLVDNKANTVMSLDGPGIVELTRSTMTTTTELNAGILYVSGALAANHTLAMSGGLLGGTGSLGRIVATNGVLSPGRSPGRLTTGALDLKGIGTTIGTTVAIELNGTTPGDGYDQLWVNGAVTLRAGVKLVVGASIVPPTDTRFIILLHDGTEPVVGTFDGLPEGATFSVKQRRYRISYRGGDGNDVVLTKIADDPETPPDPEPTDLVYYLAEGATGSFFDDDVLIANAENTAARATLTFLKEGGGTVVEHLTVPAQGRLTVHVDQIPGLEDASASVRIISDDHVPLIVERSMFWDASYYGGHTANAVEKPELKWIFAEGFQGFFDTYILIANPNAQAATATITFLRENDTPVVKTVPVGSFARQTVHAGDYHELIGRAFGIVVDADQPVIAERAMYFGNLPPSREFPNGKTWAGGHDNAGITAPSTTWFHAEGATGAFFNTYILLSNPQDAAAHVQVKFLLDTGDVVTREKTIGAKQRLTINPAAEDDPRLTDAALSTVVTSDVPIVSERSMYWPEGTMAFGEGHNSSGVVAAGEHWGLAEGRVGGEHGFDSFILLANPSTEPSDVRVTYLRENGAPIVKTYTVKPTSRFNIDVKTDVPELTDSSFGADIEVINGAPIAVEESMYWNANGIQWAGGSNALAVPLPRRP